MTDYILQITLLSPLTSSAGEGRIGLVDRDVVYDDLGLPILPGRRIKGLWHEAYREVVDAAMLCSKDLIPAGQLFGETGQIFGKTSQQPADRCAYLHVGNAVLHEPKASSLGEWLAYLQQGSNLTPDDVMQHFGNVRSQTSIDRGTGAPLENTFRITRTLKAGWVFQAPVHFIEPPNEPVLTALILGAAALQHMGTARTRGLGKVCCRFICDLTGKVLSENALPSITVPRLTKPSQVSKAEETESACELDPAEQETSADQAKNASCSNCAAPIHLLRYRLKLKTPVVVPGTDGDLNTVVTRQDISGSTVLGAAAWKYLSLPNHTPKDDKFRHAFLDGGFRFLTAYPEADENSKLKRTIPAPHSIRKFKEAASADTEDLIDLIDFAEPLSDKDKRAPKKRLECRYALISPGNLKSQFVDTERNYHHARALTDRRIGRALENDGALFQYEAIKADQSFQGAVLGSEADLKNLQIWLPTGDLIRIGKSRSAQYGEAKFEWIDNVPEMLGKFSEWDGFIELEEDLEDVDNHLIVTTLSPLLSINDNGHPDLHFPKSELAKILRLDPCDLRLLSSYTRSEVIGGYHAHLRFPRQQWPAIAAGSVFVFCLEKTLNGKDILKLEQRGLGIRKSEGYGRVAINRQGWLELKGKTEKQLSKARIEKPDGDQIPNVVHDLLCNVAHRHCLAEMKQRAIAAAGQTNNIPNNTLLGKLRFFLQQPASDATKAPNALRKPAEEKLKRCRIDTSISGETSWLTDAATLTLYQLFKDAWSKPESLAQDVIETCVNNLIIETREDAMRQSVIETLTNTHSIILCRTFLDYLLTSLHRTSRRMTTLTQ